MAQTLPQTLSFMGGESYNVSNGVATAANSQAQQALSNLGVSGNTYSSYVPPSLDTLNSNQSKITVPNSDPNSTISKASGLSTGVETSNKTLNDYINQFTAPTTQLDTQYQDLLKSLAESLGQDTGKQQYQIQQENQLGVPQLKTQISDLNSQILTGLAEQKKQLSDYQQSNQALLQNPQQIAAVVGSKQQELARTFALEQAAKSADLGLLQARQQALGGQLNTAIDLAQRAVEMKYQPIEDSIKVKQAQIDAIAPLLDKQQKIQAQALSAYYDNQQQQIAEAKAKAKSNLDLALTSGITTKFVNKNGEFFRTSDGKSYSSPEEFFKDAGVTSFDQAYQQGLIGNYNPNTSVERSLVVDLLAKYPDSGITVADTLSSAQAKLKNSRIYQDQVRGPVGSGGSATGPLGLTNTQIDNISPLVSQFQSSPIVQNYNTIGEGYNFVKSLSNTTTNPADDQALIYALAKALDPGSVVREGEYNTVQKYAQSLAQSYGKSITQAINGTGFLSEDARRNIKATIEQRFRTAEISYKNLSNETARRINLVGNTDKGDQLLNNYGGAFGSSAPGFVGPTAPQAQSQASSQNLTTPEAKGWWDKTINFLWGAD